ncbi:hypothetical protein D7S86_15465 [Pararobbsia silviterrae]|uniref:FecR protein domain-containing protein n=2 Tax=Pararobbsia silviterrae TaxID=1792498 RepID=A0A494Y0A3_9BURK|nr:hypothetical protein D7S86_15465 [Pararobbsia silviterrae]
MRSGALHYAVCVLCGLQTMSDAWASDSIGVVKTVKGVVQIERAGKNLDAAIGSDVFNGDRIVTGAASSVGVTLRDDTLLTEGANSTLLLNHFAFNTTTYDGALDATIKRGSLAVVDGRLAKANPDSVRYSTPTTTLGVRGTEFIIEVGGDAEHAQ